MKRLFLSRTWFLGACLLPLVGCNVDPINDLLLNLIIAPRPVAVPGNDKFINPGQLVVLDGSQSGVLLGDGSFQTAVQGNLSFSWEIVAAIDRATGNPIDLAGTGATLTNPNSSDPTFTANTSADYNVELTVSNGSATNAAIVGVRVY